MTINVATGGGSTGASAVASVAAVDTSIAIAGTGVNPTVGVMEGYDGILDPHKRGAVGDAILSTTMTATATSTTVTDPNLQTFVGTKTIVISGAGTNPGGTEVPYGLKTTLTCSVAGTGTLGVAATSSVAPVNAVQTLTGGATGGTFTLTWFSQVTTAIAFNATAATIQAALVALPGVGAGDVVCAGGPLNTTPVTCTFQGALAGMPLALMLVVSSLSGGSVTPTTTTPGKSGFAVYGTDDTTALQNTINAAATTAAAAGQKCMVAGRPNCSYLVPFAGPNINYPGQGGTNLGLQIAANVILKGMSFLCGDFTHPGSQAQAVIGDSAAGTDGWEIIDCVFNGSAMPNTADHEYLHWGIVLSNSTNVIIRGNTLKLFRQSAIVGAGVSLYVHVEHNNVSLTNGGAIKFAGAQWLWLDNNTIHDNYNCVAVGGSGTGAECLFFNGATAGSNQYVFIRGNYVGNWGACLVFYNLNFAVVTGNIFNTPSWAGAAPVIQYSAAGNIFQNAVVQGNIMILPVSTSNGFFELLNEQYNIISQNIFWSAWDLPILLNEESQPSSGVQFLDNLVGAPGNTGYGRLTLHASTTGMRIRHGGGTLDGVRFNATVPATPSVPATTVGQQNTFPCDANVYLVGGTVSAIAVAYGGSTGNYVTTGFTATSGQQVGPIYLKAGDYIKLTYTVAPTWVWIPVV